MLQLICPKCNRPVQDADAFCQGCGAPRDRTGWVGDPIVGKVVAGKYRIDARLGAGGMGAVFRATHFHGATDLGQVVIKFLLAEYAQDPERRARFVKEARAARELRSPHVVKVFDFGDDEDGTPYLVMELLEGRSLFSVMAEAGLLPVRRALRIGMQVAEAMVECHDKGILHRDLKPDNLLLLDSRAGDFVKIVDFGIARVPAGPAGPQAHSMVSSLVIGTPRYMAPEQILGQPIDGRMDIFALGVILFEVMCGSPPILLKPGDNEMAYVALNITEPPRKVSDVLVGVPPELDALLDRMMAKTSAERPERMADVLLALEQISRLQQLGAEQPGPETEAWAAAAAQLLQPRASPVRHRLNTTFSALVGGRRRYLVPALLGAVIGLALLVVWLLAMGPRAPAQGVAPPSTAQAEAPALPQPDAAGTPLGLIPPALPPAELAPAPAEPGESAAPPRGGKAPRKRRGGRSTP